LPSLHVGKLDQALDRFDGQGGKAFVEFVDAFAKFVPANDGIRQDARTAHDGPARHRAGNSLDQFACGPVDFRPYPTALLSFIVICYSGDVALCGRGTKFA